MATYAIGDLQGCCDAFARLLDRIAFDPAEDTLWLVGDLVNRGPDSLGSLRRVKALGDSAIVVLGNHDLHLLAVSSGARKLGKSDTLTEVLAAPDAEELLAWLRHRPLAHRATITTANGRIDTLMVHAGVLPIWTTDDVMAYAAELERALRGRDWQGTLAELFGNLPARWSDALTGADRLRTIVNALTRLRYCSADGSMEFENKNALTESGVAEMTRRGYMPWFDVPQRATGDVALVFGHWSTLGLIRTDRLIALDTGCVWGGALTAVRLEDRAVFQEACPQYRRPD